MSFQSPFAFGTFGTRAGKAVVGVGVGDLVTPLAETPIGADDLFDDWNLLLRATQEWLGSGPPPTALSRPLDSAEVRARTDRTAIAGGNAAGVLNLPTPAQLRS